MALAQAGKCFGGTSSAGLIFLYFFGMVLCALAQAGKIFGGTWRGVAPVLGGGVLLSSSSGGGSSVSSSSSSSGGTNNNRYISSSISPNSCLQHGVLARNLTNSLAADHFLPRRRPSFLSHVGSDFNILESFIFRMLLWLPGKSTLRSTSWSSFIAKTKVIISVLGVPVFWFLSVIIDFRSNTH